jgi:cysteine desulfurase
MEAEAVSAMLPFLTEAYGNPSSLYRLAAKSRAAIAGARREVAALIDADPSEITFTSGGTEADNWALIGAFEAAGGVGQIVTTAIEHPAVLRTCEYLERERGARVTYLPVDEKGRVSVESAIRAMTKDTILLSVMTANNEVGTIEPIAELARAAHDAGALFHTDAVQAYGHIPLSVRSCPIDLLSVSGHKFGGPKGSGFLYIRKGVSIGAYLRGGAQERNRRAGTEHTAGIVGLGAAAKIAGGALEERASYVRRLRDHLTERLETELSGIRINGDRERCLPGTLSVTIDSVLAETALILLDQRGIAASGGSACSSGSLDPSHVLLAMGRTEEEARSTIRLTLGYENTIEEIDEAADALIAIAESLRSRKRA